MDRPRDYADGELRGLERYFPTPLSRVLLVSLLTAPAGTFWLILENSERLFPGYEDSFQNLVSAMVALTLAFFILLALAIDLIVVAHHSKHRRIRLHRINFRCHLLCIKPHKSRHQKFTR